MLSLLTMALIDSAYSAILALQQICEESSWLAQAPLAALTALPLQPSLINLTASPTIQKSHPSLQPPSSFLSMVLLACVD
jgi:hypothetical protein